MDFNILETSAASSAAVTQKKCGREMRNGGFF